MKIADMKKFILTFCLATKCLASTEGVDALDGNPLSISMLVCNSAMGIEYIEGNCYEQFSPCSTFKFPLAIMGFDSGILKTKEDPEWESSSEDSIAFDAWRGHHTPQSWMKNSVVWYSQKMTQMLGFEKFNEYIHQWNYGNKDVSGTPGMNDGLTHSWLNSSLQISTKEQILFIRKFVNSELPISAETQAKIESLMRREEVVEGWQIFGKTGGSGKYVDEKYPDMLLQHGWFIGWIRKVENESSFYPFAIHIVEPYNTEKSPGIHAKEMMMQKIKELILQGRM